MAVSKRLLKAVVMLELLGVLGAYGLFQQMDKSQDFRSSMKRRCPSVLEVYYQSNEWAGQHGVRERDQEAWSSKQH
ncbi:protein CEBPZOS [Cynoglossus semilaevis]|uniref:protein CEBPZOS n=1 Tax=Cynoglossus semilaevis TaxID=244447 RepID=UPI0007DCABDA|nr:protein CEBPZOS [Cynoglossus semilaevis]XP_016889002.1 protein CEBPZOS [Cynoglossus semilaevis]